MSKKAMHIMDTLNQMYPDAKAELIFSNEFELLVAVVLSAQTTDKAVNAVTKALFKRYPTAYDMMHAKVDEVEMYIKRIGLYHNKAQFLIKLSTQIVELFNGNVPSKREDLESLAGVGRKTANVVLSNAFQVPAFAVDTHVARISKRLGIALSEDDVFKIEAKLEKAFPKKAWSKLHHQMIFFGRYHCKAVSPKCEKCPLYDMCVDPIKIRNVK